MRFQSPLVYYIVVLNTEEINEYLIVTYTDKLTFEKGQAVRFKKKLLIVARFQAVLCQNVNVGIKLHVVAFAWYRNCNKLTLIALLNLSSWCLLMVKRLFLTVPQVVCSL